MRYLFIIILALILILGTLYLIDGKDFCLDTSICKENQKVNTEFGEILINKENCLKYNWKWDSKKKECNLN